MRILQGLVLRLLLALSAFILFSCSGEDSRSEPSVDSSPAGLFDSTWLSHDYWGEGLAEINLYRASIIKYGEPRSTEDVVHILVSEDHLPDLLVKADDWRQPGLLPVLKFNQLVEVQTGIYPYRQMLTIFFDRTNGRFAKLTFGSQEWCGNSFKEVVNFRGVSSFHFNTYWDGQGAGSFQVNFPEGLVPYDALPIQLRMLELEAGLTAQFPFLSSQISSRASPPMIEQARIEVGSPVVLEVPAGAFQAFPIQVGLNGGQDLIWLETQFPHRMIRWETHAGDLYELAKSQRLAYWELNRPGDESLLQ